MSAGYRAVHCQLAFALFLQKQLPCLKQTCAFDPVFSVLDKNLLNEYGITVSVVPAKTWLSSNSIANEHYREQLPHTNAWCAFGNCTELLTGV